MSQDEKFPPEYNQPSGYVPPPVWQEKKSNSGTFAAINRPTAGAQKQQNLPVGDAALQLYSLGTPNGMKVTILLEELLAAGYADAAYDAWQINIGKGDQFGSDFVAINPNSKIPALIDYQPQWPTGHERNGQPMRVFESASIMMYLAEKFAAFLPADLYRRTQTMNWLMWQMGSAPFLGGGFGHFYVYAPLKIEYAIDRYAMEVKRQLDVLNQHLQQHEFMGEDQYTLADMAIWPWYGRLVMHQAYNDAGTFLAVDAYEHVQRWAQQLAERPAVQRGIREKLYARID